MLYFIPVIRLIYETRRTQTPVRLSMWFLQKIIGFNRGVYWPVHHSSLVSSPMNILIGIDTGPGYMPGCYIQGRGGIIIGDYSQISCNVGIISQNHNLYDCRDHIQEIFPSVVIGKYCWIGMNSVILPGVRLGDFTIVGAGSVVTKSFIEGYQIVAGNPARTLRYLNKTDAECYGNSHEYHGYIKKDQFEKFRLKYLHL